MSEPVCVSVVLLEPALMAATRHADLETARRAEVILAKFKWGIYPHTPANLLDLITAYRQADAKGKEVSLDKIFALGTAGYRVVGKLLAAEEVAAKRTPLYGRVCKRRSTRGLFSSSKGTIHGPGGGQLASAGILHVPRGSLGFSNQTTRLFTG
jgi:hypothetical protein